MTDALSLYSMFGPSGSINGVRHLVHTSKFGFRRGQHSTFWTIQPVRCESISVFRGEYDARVRIGMSPLIQQPKLVTAFPLAEKPGFLANSPPAPSAIQHLQDKEMS